VQLFSTISQNYGLIRILHKITFIVSLGLSLLPLLMTFSDDAFTSRGVLWRSAKQLINDSPIIGNGQSYWTHQFSSQGFVANYGTHNIWLDNLVAFGFVGLSLFMFTLLSIRRRRVNSELYVLLATVFILGTTESSFQLWKLSGGMPFFLLILLFSKEAKSLIQASNKDKSTRRN
jgi:O-antigen ligase